MTAKQTVALVVALPLVVIAAIFVGRAIADAERNGDDGIGIEVADDVDTFEHDYLIPAGTADAIEAGETVEIVPQTLEVSVGESIRIINDDDEGHVVGVFYVGAGETLTRTFTSPGELSGQCSIHSDGEFTVRVNA